MDDQPKRVFLLSPASCSGRRAQVLLNERATFDLARAVRSRKGVPLADAFAFLSGLYFRGKITYARRFVVPQDEENGIYVITAGGGLVPADTCVRVTDLREFARVPIDLKEPRYTEPLQRDAQALAGRLPSDAQVILLGSVATEKYVRILGDEFGRRLMFPSAFAGLGDMSRGGLMLRCVREERELDYVMVERAMRHGKRPTT